MCFSKVIGLEHIKKHLLAGVQSGRIPHAQLFNGKETLPLVIAYAQAILCNDSENKSACDVMVSKLAHPDLHFAFPVATTEKVKSNPTSALFSDQWREFVLKNPYGNLFNWFQILGIENKQGIINVAEAQEIVKKLSLKSYQGGYKVMIIWMSEKMNTEAANKLLKLLEEPPKKTVFILTTEDKSQLLDTIVSRCQVIEIPSLSEEQIAQTLSVNKQIPYEEAKNFARLAQGSYGKAIEIYRDRNDDSAVEDWAINWVRIAFKAKKNKAVINELLLWSEEIAGTGREVQKKFLNYATEFFRQALLLNYGADSLVYMKIKNTTFSLAKLAPFIHGNNIVEIIQLLEEAIYHIERNGNSKLIFSDLSFKLTRLLHKSTVNN